jgi:hypothetical protein
LLYSINQREGKMTMPEFKTHEDLINFLTNQERRISNLEKANAELIGEIKKRFIQKEELPAMLSNVIPKTGLFNQSFIKRAFSVWGHYFVAQLFLAAIVMAFYFVVFILLLGKFAS